MGHVGMLLLLLSVSCAFLKWSKLMFHTSTFDSRLWSHLVCAIYSSDW